MRLCVLLCASMCACVCEFMCVHVGCCGRLRILVHEKIFSRTVNHCNLGSAHISRGSGASYQRSGRKENLMRAKTRPHTFRYMGRERVLPANDQVHKLLHRSGLERQPTRQGRKQCDAKTPDVHLCNCVSSEEAKNHN